MNSYALKCDRWVGPLVCILTHGFLYLVKDVVFADLRFFLPWVAAVCDRTCAAKVVT